MLVDSLETIKLHFKRANVTYSEIIEINLTLDVFDDDNIVKAVDAFIYRFIKIQDFMGGKLFKDILVFFGDYKDNMTLVDVIDKLEKYGIEINSDNWIENRGLRNKLTHEYPNNEEELLVGIELAIKYFEKMNKIMKSINEFLDKKKNKKDMKNGEIYE